ncbi:MAG: hypothetical protein PHR16_08410 [Methylovulum sp.]|nr:hypothetical protein [Methylovulum sp.]
MAQPYMLSPLGLPPGNAINRHQHDTLLPPIQIIPALTPQFSDAVMAALTLDPKQRPGLRLRGGRRTPLH